MKWLAYVRSKLDKQDPRIQINVHRVREAAEEAGTMGACECHCDCVYRLLSVCWDPLPVSRDCPGESALFHFSCTKVLAILRARIIS